MLIPAHCQSCKEELENEKLAALEEHEAALNPAQADAESDNCDTVEGAEIQGEDTVQVEESVDSEAGS